MVLELNDTSTQARLAAFIAQAAGAESCTVEASSRLSGGAIQENVALTVRLDGGTMAGRHELVLRTTPDRPVADSMTRAQEFRVIQAAARAGVTVPEPLWLYLEHDLIGRPFYLMRRIQGVATGHMLVKGDPRPDLLRRLGEELGHLHRITPPDPTLDFLPNPEPSPALYLIGVYRGWLDRLREPYPVLEYGLRWLEERAPAAGEIVLCHRDYRTGNYMVDGDRITGILDWEFAGWGDPMEDLGWFCARSWRFGRLDREAGGLGDRADLYAAYEATAGRTVDRQRVDYWEVMAYIRWAAIALLQADRHLSGAEPSLELALTGRKPPEMELDLLLTIERLEAQRQIGS